jgi:hypothetical protein
VFKITGLVAIAHGCFGPHPLFPKCLIPVYSVEKLGTWVLLVLIPGHLARVVLLDMPSSVQMMGFVG